MHRLYKHLFNYGAKAKGWSYIIIDITCTIMLCIVQNP
jgi:hypothetical protein